MLKLRLLQSAEDSLRTLAWLAGWPSFVCAPFLILLSFQLPHLVPTVDPSVTTGYFRFGLAWLILRPIGLVWYKNTATPVERETKRRRTKYPDAPWQWNDGWADGVVDDDGGVDSTRGFGNFFLFFLFSWEVVFGTSIDLVATLLIDDIPFEGFLLFRIIVAMLAVYFGVYLGITSLHTIRNWAVPGRYRLRLDAFPISSTVLRGELRFPRRRDASESVEVILRCDRGIDELWLSRHEISKDAIRHDGRESVTRIEFAIPENLPDTSPTLERNAEGKVLWDLELAFGKTKDALLAPTIRFPLPVFRNSDANRMSFETPIGMEADAKVLNPTD